MARYIEASAKMAWKKSGRYGSSAASSGAAERLAEAWDIMLEVPVETME